MKNKVTIKDVAYIISGYSFRSAIKEDIDGDIYVLQTKDIQDNILSDSQLTRISGNIPKANAFVKNDDIVVSARGFFKSAVVKSDKSIIASSSVYIIRLVKNNIIPEYLSIYLNSNAGLKEISKITKGVTIKTVLRRDLENIEIPVPNMETQKKIVNIYYNKKHQESILKRKIEINASILEGVLQHISK